MKDAGIVRQCLPACLSDNTTAVDSLLNAMRYRRFYIMYHKSQKPSQLLAAERRAELSPSVWRLFRYISGFIATAVDSPSKASGEPAEHKYRVKQLENKKRLKIDEEM